MTVANFSVKNSVLVNLMMIGLFLFGGIALVQLPTELNPLVEFNWVFIIVPYPGAAPTEVENLVVDPIEAEIQDVDKITEIQSSAFEGRAEILVKFEDISDDTFRELFTDIKSEVDKVELPEECEDPIYDTFDSGDFLPVIAVDMTYNIPEDNAQFIAEDFEDDVSDINGVANVAVSGLAEREIWVEVDPIKLNALSVTFDEIVFALKLRNLNVPGGNITFGKSEYLIRSIGEYESIEEIRNTIVRTSPGGEFIKISDVATVNDRREEMEIISRRNGSPAITFSVAKKTEANSIDVIDDVKDLVREYRKRVPDGVDFSWINDNSVYIRRVIGVLRNNAVFGLVLIVGILFFFLGLRNALLAALGIPISFLITFIFMRATGYSLNGSSLFALVMVLGIIVDDAIIVLENCHRHRLMGENSEVSAIRGTNEVTTPILTSIGTNIAAFLPLILLPGIMGRFMRVVPMVFSLALVASLFEAFFLLPSHYADWTKRSRVQKRGEKKFFIHLRNFYSKLLFRVLKRRYWLLGGMVALLLISIAMIPLVGIELFPDEDFDQFKLLVQFPEGTSLEETDRIMRKFEQAALELPKSEVQDVVVNVGLLQGNETWLTKKNVAQILFQLYPKEERSMSIDDLIAMMRERAGKISGPIFLELQMLSGGPPTGSPIAVRVQGKYMDEIKAASLALQDFLRTVDGAFDISDDFPPGKQEIRIDVDEEKTALYGFSTQYVAMNVRYAFDGVDATEYRDGDDEIDVVVKYDERSRSSIDDVLNLKLTNPQRQTVALRDMVNFEIRPGATEINRWDQKRTIIVSGQLDRTRTTVDRINARLTEKFPDLETQYPGVTFTIGGEFEEFVQIFSDIIPLFALSIILIFLILGTQFNSYIQPLIILTTVPFALIGAMLGLIISGNPFSVSSLYGLVALAGIVVNDAIVMISFINRRRREHDPTVCGHWRSIIDGGKMRLRPIILTSLTTISGLMPMAFGLGGKSAWWSPLANVILFGLLGSTILTLFAIPSLVAVIDDIKRSRRKARLKRTMGEEKQLPDCTNLAQ